MTTAVAEAGSAQPAVSPASYPASGREWVTWALLFSSTCIIVGLLWDISWHMSVGRDRLWTAPHVLEQIGASVAGLACGWIVLSTTFAGSAAQRASTVRFWGFRGPLGGWVAIWGSLAMMFSVPFDDWWHNAYGLDVKILSPPHVVLLFGMIAIQLGAMLLTLGMQNRAEGRRAASLGLAYAFAAGALIAMVATALSEYTLRPNDWHARRMYVVSAAAYPLFLVAVARAGRIRYPATVTAALYMSLYLVTQWVIVQFPATPRLSPILNPLTHMAAFGFPLLLVVPALGIDLVMKRTGIRGDWKLAALIGVVFTVAMLAAHWPCSAFLLKSPLAQNNLFLAHHWTYSTTLGPFRFEYWNLDGPGGTWSASAFLGGIAVATVVAFLSARVGLVWGAWMRRVRR